MEKERKSSQVCGALEETQVDEAAEKAGEFLSVVFVCVRVLPLREVIKEGSRL